MGVGGKKGGGGEIVHKGCHDHAKTKRKEGSVGQKKGRQASVRREKKRVRGVTRVVGKKPGTPSGKFGPIEPNKGGRADKVGVKVGPAKEKKTASPQKKRQSSKNTKENPSGDK